MDSNSSSFTESFAKILYGGINPNIPGHGGEVCAKYLDRKLMILDTAIATIIMIVMFIKARKKYSYPVLKNKPVGPVSKQVLLVFMCLMFGVEIGYKICSGRVLYLLNPCHVITMVELYLLAAKQSPRSMAVLRLLIHYLHCALIAILFPDTNARLFPGEVSMYWIQHIMIFFIIPPYLVYMYGIETLEPLKELSWSCYSGILFGIHHLYVMQPVGIWSHVNLNFVLCPADKDPFNGPYYRLLAVFHQAFCLLTMGKIYSLVLHLIMPSPSKKNTKTS